MNRISMRIVLVLTLVFLTAQIAPASNVMPGLPPFGSFSGGPFDVVNNANLNVHFEIPLLSKAGRGLPFNYPDRYDSTIWTIGGNAWTPTTVTIWGWPNGAFELVMGFVYASATQGSCTSGGQTYYYNIYSSWHYKQPSNPGYFTLFSFSVSDASVGTPCTGAPPYSATATATDGSGVTISATAQPSATIYFRSGNTLNPSLQWAGHPSTLTDTNGNQITATAPSSSIITDTLGTTAITVNGSGTPSSPVTVQYTNAAGTTSTVTVNYTAYTVQTNFGCSGITEYGPTSVNLVSSITLPDNTSYSFTYEVTPGDSHNPRYVTGRIASVTQPTGGTISYNYTGGNNGIICTDGTAAGLTRTTPDGAWTYTRSGSDPAWSTTITDPQSNQTVLNFQGIYETQRQVYQGSTSGTLLKTVYTCYNGAAYPCNSTAITPPITQIAATNSWGSGQTSQTVTMYNAYGLPTEVDEYANGSGSPGSMVRKTLTTYASLGNNISDRPASIAVYAAGSGTPSSQTTYTYDQGSVTATSGTPQHIAITGSRGNPTTVTYTIQGSTTISTTATFFDTGTVQTASDSKGNQTTYAYGNCGNSFVTSITMPLSLSRSQSWNCNGSAAIASATDENGRITSYSYDSMNRLTQTNLPDGGWKLTTYTGATQQDSYTGITDTTPSSGCTGCRHDQTNLDNQGRQLNSILVSDPEGQTTVATVYDSVGRVQKISNPYRSTNDPTYGFDTRAYDSLHRVTSVTHQDNNVAYTYYGPNVGTHGGAGTQLCASGTYGLGYPALQVDEAGKKRQVWSDALRRAIEADEPDSSGNLTVVTCYKYDVLNNLIEVDQGSQTRTYAYDGLSRKTSEITPEAGTRNFYFTTSGGALCAGDPKSLCRETGARAITITYAYDALNRLTGKTYSDSTPAASYFYDQTSYNGLTITNGKARRTGMSDGSGQTAWSYNTTGRVLTEKRTISSITKTLSYTYNLDGSMATLTYPSGRVITYSYSHAQRPVSAVDSVNSINYALLATYAPQGALATATLGKVNGGFAGISRTLSYNNRLQISTIQSTSSNGTVQNLAYQYGTSNNGTITSITNNLNTGRTQNFTYDYLNRVATAQTQGSTGSTCWGQGFGYDRYGNLTSATVTKCSAPTLSLTVNNSNRITNTGFTYDSDGNLTGDGALTYSWDAEARLTLSAGVTYVYDGDGRRVKNSRLYWSGINATPVAETDLSGNITNEYVFFGGLRIARRDSTGAVFYNHGDHLSTARVTTNATGVTQQESDYYPFGGELVVTSGSGTSYKFTGYERDSETGLDHTWFRKYSSNIGRWHTPDPFARGAKPAMPGTWNRYAYVLGNPTNFLDILGLDACGWNASGPTSAQAWNCLPAANYINPGYNPNQVTFYYTTCTVGPPPTYTKTCTNQAGNTTVGGNASSDLTSGQTNYTQQIGLLTPQTPINPYCGLSAFYSPTVVSATNFMQTIAPPPPNNISNVPSVSTSTLYAQATSTQSSAYSAAYKSTCP